MKRNLAWFALGFALAELAAANLPPLVCVPAAALFAFAVLGLRKRSLHIPALGAVCGFVYFAVFAVLFVRPVQAQAGQTVTAAVTVQTDAEAAYEAYHMRGTLLITELDGKPAHIRVQCSDFPATEAGERFTAKFSLRTLKNDRYRLASQSKGVYLRADYVGSYAPLPASRHPVFGLFRLRQRGSTALKHWIPADSAALISAMLLGDTTRLSDADRDAFAAAGVSHLLAVSGLHVALLAGLLFPHRRRFAHAALAVQAGVIVGYMLVTGLPVSVLRAGLVFLLAILGHWFLQPVDLLTSTGAAALLLGLQNAYMPCDLGFQLSFCAVLGVQCAAALANPLKSRLPKRIFKLISAAMTAALASLFTLPILVAHGMTISAVGILGNLLTLPLMRYLLLLGLAVLGLSCLPFLAPLCHMVSFLLALLLKLLRGIVLFCASLPGARLLLPARYTLFVLGVLAVLAIVYYLAGRLRFYLPAALCCAALAVFMGVRMQQGIVTVALVGTAGNPCAVITQDGQAAVVFRGGAANRRAVKNYLARHGEPVCTLAVDLRATPGDIGLTADRTVNAAAQTAPARYEVLDGLTLDLYHKGSSSLAVLEVGDRHIALMSGSIKLDTPVQVDVLCAAGALSDSVQAETILFTSESPRWLADADAAQLYYGSDTPAVVLRPGAAMIFEEAKPYAVQ
ncbi:ComEC/Rec2 family competence protein [uncultured Gemmiger sp.]|uniref:ComEC/Rec2 family competence protein n=1 Tax=uncultured Gemmiger sp. TaxID=1623490 RepID=UPI0025DA7D31|nr:ComEC/Rec2 family competence protein [uncultured Gemmiger sp.]